MRYLITLTNRIVEHNDAQAAGFGIDDSGVDLGGGYWWSISSADDDHYVQSAAPTRELAEEYARRALPPHATSVDVRVEGELARRPVDEQRVKDHIGDWARALERP